MKRNEKKGGKNSDKKERKGANKLHNLWDPGIDRAKLERSIVDVSVSAMYVNV